MNRYGINNEVTAPMYTHSFWVSWYNIHQRNRPLTVIPPPTVWFSFISFFSIYCNPLHLNRVALRRPRLVVGWVTVSGATPCPRYLSLYNQSPKPTQLGYIRLWVGANEYWQVFSSTIDHHHSKKRQVLHRSQDPMKPIDLCTNKH